MSVVRCRWSLLSSSLLFLVAAGIAPASAQTAGLDPYLHTYHPEHGYVPVAGYGAPVYGYGYGGGLPNNPAAGAGVLAAGRGQEAAGIGQMHLSNAQAAGAYEQARTQYLQNQGLEMQTIQQNASVRRQADDAFQARMLAQEQAQVALYHKSMQQMAAAHRLTAEQFDMDRGVLHWPFCLRGPEYKDVRNKLDLLFDARTPEDSGTNSSGYTGIVEACQQMTKIVKDQVKNGMPVTDFVTAKHFIDSIEYEAQFPVKAAKADPSPQPGGAAVSQSR